MLERCGGLPKRIKAGRKLWLLPTPHTAPHKVLGTDQVYSSHCKPASGQGQQGLSRKVWPVQAKAAPHQVSPPIWELYQGLLPIQLNKREGHPVVGRWQRSLDSLDPPSWLKGQILATETDYAPFQLNHRGLKAEALCLKGWI